MRGGQASVSCTDKSRANERYGKAKRDFARYTPMETNTSEPIKGKGVSKTGRDSLAWDESGGNLSNGQTNPGI
jgi:hypothetical protein